MLKDERKEKKRKAKKSHCECRGHLTPDEFSCFFLHCRPLRAFIPRVAYQQHMCVTVMEPVGEQLGASVHGGRVVATQAAGLWAKSRDVGQTALH